MEKQPLIDLLRPDDWVAVSRADLEELVTLAAKEGISMPDHAEVTRIHFSEKLSDEGTVHEFHWTGSNCDPWTIGTRLDYPVFKRRMLNTLPMLRQAADKRGHMMYLRLAKQRAAYAMTCIRRYRRERDNMDHLKEAMRVLDEIKGY